MVSKGNKMVPFPKYLVAGDDWNFNVSVKGYPSSDYTLSIIPRGNNELQTLTTTATSDGTSYTFAIPASVTATFIPGLYFYQVECVSVLSGARYTVATNSFTIKPDFNQLSIPFDGRSRWQKRLTLLDTYIDTRLGNSQDIDIKSIKIEGYELEKWSLDNLFNLRARFEARIRSENGIPVIRKQKL